MKNLKKFIRHNIFYLLLFSLALVGCSTGGAEPEVAEPLPTDIPPTEEPAPASTAVSGLGEKTAQSVELTVDGGSETQNYWLYLPENYTEQESWPLIIYLHSVNGQGDDITLVKDGFTNEIGTRLLQLPAIVVAPQTPADTIWEDRIPILVAFLTAVEKEYAVDSDRIYLTGYDIGGNGTLAWGLHNPERFAAVVPVAFGSYVTDSPSVPDDICNLENTPVWAIAGRADTVAASAYSKVMIEGLEACGGELARITVYDDANHVTIATRPYSSYSDLYAWLWEQSLQ